jgi:curved DNA-binding protein CbpA
LQAALRTHPDKNPGNPEATQQFQRIGEAFKVLERHLTKPAGRPGFGSYGGRYDDEDFYDDDDYDYDSDDDFYDLGELYFM